MCLCSGCSLVLITFMSAPLICNCLTISYVTRKLPQVGEAKLITCVPGELASDSLRLYQTDRDGIIFNGHKMYSDGIDLTRFNATRLTGTGGSLLLSIGDLHLEDAKKYGCINTRTGEESHVNLVILGESQPALIRAIVSDSTVEHRCSMKFAGQPDMTSVSWLDSHGLEMPLVSHESAVQGSIESRTNLSQNDRSSWPYTCEVSLMVRTVSSARGQETTEFKFRNTNAILGVKSESGDMLRTLYDVFWVLVLGGSVIVVILVWALASTVVSCKLKRRQHGLSSATSSQDGSEAPLVPEKPPGTVYAELQPQNGENPYAEMQPVAA
jgi:hypothetical protein